MSPEVAASVVDAVACPLCGSGPGERCKVRAPRPGTPNNLRLTPHRERVYADLFKESPTP